MKKIDRKFAIQIMVDTHDKLRARVMKILIEHRIDSKDFLKCREAIIKRIAAGTDAETVIMDAVDQLVRMKTISERQVTEYKGPSMSDVMTPELRELMKSL